MTVTSEVSREQYNGSGSTGPFAFNHKIFDETHLKVVKTVSGVDTVLTITTDYTVSVAADFASASVTLVSVLASGQLLTVTLDPPLSQEIRWPRNDPFPAATHERAADLAVMLIKRVDEKVGRSLLLPESSTLSDLVIPNPQAGLALGWNSAEDNFANITIPTIYVQNAEPTGQIVLNSLWIDSDSTDIDVYQYSGSAWVDSGLNLRGPQGIQGDPGIFEGNETQVTALGPDLIPLQDESDSDNPKRATAQSVAETGRVLVQLSPYQRDDEVDVVNGAGALLWFLPTLMDGYKLTSVEASHHTAGSGTGTTTIQLSKNDVTDILSTRLTIDSTDTSSADASTPAVINSANNTFAAGDKLRVDVDAIPNGTVPVGLNVNLVFTPPQS